MRHIFVSHAGEDAVIAERLANDLRNAGHETRIDKHELKLGADTIKFINEGVGNAHTIVILYSKHTPAASWQELEINSALWNEVAQDGGNCIVIRLDNTQLPPVLGPKLFAELNDSNYKKAFEDLCDAIIPSTSATSTLVEAFKEESPNPFRRVRAEYFEDLPNLLAQTFSPPDAMKVHALEDMKPCFLEGSRGTGKSMLLLSLRARNLAARQETKVKLDQLFGFYIKLTRGSVCNLGIASDTDSDPQQLFGKNIVQITDAFSQEFVVCLLESLLSEIEVCIKENYIKCPTHAERHLAESIYALLSGNTSGSPITIEGILKYLTSIHRQLANFLRRKFIYEEKVAVPIASLDLDSFKNILQIIREAIPEISKAVFVVLLDEYENLFTFQQRVVNGFVKFGPPNFTLKVAKKMGSVETSGTNTGQELQEIHDYNRVTLIYDVEEPKQFAAFCKLLEHITKNLLKSAGLIYDGMEMLLPKFAGAEVDEAQWLDAIALLAKLSTEEFKVLSYEDRQNKITYYGEAATYRILLSGKGRRKPKRFSGFQELALLSSGVIRYFQEIIGVAFYLQYAGKTDAKQPLTISSENQTQASHIVSQHNLTTLSRNVEKYGERLKYYILDLGDCVRHKLLKHTSEPEAGRITITDPELLEKNEYGELKKALILGTREGLFQTKEGRPAFKPKHGSDPQPTEFNVCRIYAPVLQISPRLRWRTNLTCLELLNLWKQDQRADAKKNIMNKIVKEIRAEDSNGKNSQGNLGFA